MSQLQTLPTTEPEPLRVPLSRLRGDADDLLATARRRRVLLTRRGKVVGELLWRGDPDGPTPPAPPPRLNGALADLLRLRPDADLTAPVDVEWDALS